MTNIEVYLTNIPLWHGNCRRKRPTWTAFIDHNQIKFIPMGNMQNDLYFDEYYVFLITFVLSPPRELTNIIFEIKHQIRAKQRDH